MKGTHVGNQEAEQPDGRTESGVTPPHVFISHDARDADLAESFSKLLRSVSAGMIKTFHSSSKKGGDGIDFGDEWYRRLMLQLQTTSDVVCLFTERSLARPWILFEAGVAKGKMDTQVIGVALGVPLTKVSSGPFYQFMNMDDSEADLKKLVFQLASRVPGLELDDEVVRHQITMFKESESEILKKLQGSVSSNVSEDVDTSAVAKLSEELKALPSRIVERLSEGGDVLRRRRMRHFHPMMLEELVHMAGEPGDPVGLLFAASLVRDDMPWLYELAMEAYRAIKSGNLQTLEQESRRLRRFSKNLVHGPWMEVSGMRDKESHYMMMEFPRILEQLLDHALQARKDDRVNKRKIDEIRPISDIIL